MLMLYLARRGASVTRAARRRRPRPLRWVAGRFDAGIGTGTAQNLGNAARRLVDLRGVARSDRFVRVASPTKSCHQCLWRNRLRRWIRARRFVSVELAGYRTGYPTRGSPHKPSCPCLPSSLRSDLPSLLDKF